MKLKIYIAASTLAICLGLFLIPVPMMTAHEPGSGHLPVKTIAFYSDDGSVKQTFAHYSDDEKASTFQSITGKPVDLPYGRTVITIKHQGSSNYRHATDAEKKRLATLEAKLNDKDTSNQVRRQTWKAIQKLTKGFTLPHTLRTTIVLSRIE